MRSAVRMAVVTFASATLALSAGPARAADPAGTAPTGEVGEYEGLARMSNVGVRIEVVPELLVPTEGGPVGGGVGFEGRYGFDVGPVILAPGARLDGDFFSGRFAGMAMPTVRMTIPVGAFAPYGMGGVGAGGLTNPYDGGFAVLLGGGLMFHLSRGLGLGAEVTYQTITSSSFHMIAIGPLVQIGEP